MLDNITIDDVAKYAGVSRATAGRVVGNYGSVSEKSRRKVLAAVAALEYRPNAIAQGLRSHATKTLGVILGSIKNNYCNALVYAIEKEASANGYNVLICNSHEKEQEEISQLQNIYSKQVDGILLIPTSSSDTEIPPNFRDLYGGSVPMVLVDREIKGLSLEIYQSNNFDASYDAAKYLLSLGHRKIGIIGTRSYSTVNDRIRGYEKALSEAGIPSEESLIVRDDYYEKHAGERLTAKLLSEHPDITALYILNDTFTPGVLLELKRRGLLFPRDISLLAWDDEEINELFDITTIVQPVEETGRMAARRLLEIIKNPKENQTAHKTQLSAHMVERKSCAAPKSEIPPRG